jgi:hypothetical protein
MNNKFKAIITTLVAVNLFLAIACTARAQTINSAEELKAFLDKQPANSPDKPIKVTLSANGMMMKDIVAAINSAGKYVSLNFSGSALTIIPNNAFYDESTEKGCTLLTAISIPDSVTLILPGAFERCFNLTSVTIGSNVTYIGEDAFYRCTGLTSVTIGNSVDDIAADAFNGCRSLTSITIPKSVTYIGTRAFYNCTSLTSVRFEGTDTSTSVSRSGEEAIEGDLFDKYFAGGIGTYTRPSGSSNTWTKQ